MSDDQRAEAAKRALINETFGAEYAPDLAELALYAADHADREAGIHRVRVDDATVERVARALWDHDMSEDTTPEWREMAWNDMKDGEDYERAQYFLRADAVLAALTGSAS